MISNQILQSTLEGFKNIGRLDFVITDMEGAVLAQTCEIEGIANACLEFARMPAESMEAKGFQYFKIYDGLEISMDIFRPVEIIPSLSAINDAKTAAEKEMSERLDEFNELGVQILENNVKIIMYDNRVEAKGTFEIIRPVGSKHKEMVNHTKIVGNGENYEYNGIDN